MKTLYKHTRSGDIFDDSEGVEQINGGKRNNKTRAIVAGYVEKVSAQIFDRYQ